MFDENGVFVYILRDGKIAKESLNILADGDTFFVAQNTFSDSDFLITQTINPQDIGKSAIAQNKDIK